MKHGCKFLSGMLKLFFATAAATSTRSSTSTGATASDASTSGINSSSIS